MVFWIYYFRKVDWSREQLVEIRKDFYDEDRKVSKRDKGEIKDWLREKEITIEEKGRNKVKHHELSWIIMSYHEISYRIHV